VTKVLFFTASWCQPCLAVKRILKENPEIADRIEVVDIEENALLAKQHSIRGVPTFVKPDGTRHLGALSKKDLLAFVGAAPKKEEKPHEP